MLYMLIMIIGDMMLILEQGFFFGVGIRSSAGVFNVIMLSVVPLSIWFIMSRLLGIYKQIPTLFSKGKPDSVIQSVWDIIRFQRPLRLLLVLLIQSLAAVLWQGFWWHFVLKSDFWFSLRYFQMYLGFGLGLLLAIRLVWSFLVFYQLLARRSLILRVLRGLLVAAVILFQLPAIILSIRYHDQKYTLDDASTLRYEYAIVPGAGVFANGRISIVLQDRVNSAADLYENGVVSHILLSGDNADSSHNEVDAMFEVAEEAGVPSSALLRDNDGFSTVETCQNASRIFGISRAVIVTQNFHTTRSLFLCELEGIDAVTVSADRSVYNISSWLLWHINDWIKLSLTFFAYYF